MLTNDYVLRKESLLIKKTKTDTFVQGALKNDGVDATGALLNSSVSHVVNTFPGIANWKDCNSRFLGCSESMAQLANLKSPKKIIGCSDEDMPWGINGYADVFREEDREVIEHGTINYILGKYVFAKGEKVVLTQKTPVINSDGYITSIINYLTAINYPTITHITQTLQYSGVNIDATLIDHIKALFVIQENHFMFSPREEECLYFLIRGLTAKHIGKALNLSHRTVEFYIACLKKKLKCNKLSALIIKSIQMGYMDNIPTNILVKKYI